MPGRTRKPEDTAPPTAPAPDIRQAAAARRDAFEAVAPADRGMVDALLAERRGYVQRDLTNRVAQVDEQLRLRGYDPAEQDD